MKKRIFIFAFVLTGCTQLVNNGTGNDHQDNGLNGRFQNETSHTNNVQLSLSLNNSDDNSYEDNALPTSGVEFDNALANFWQENSFHENSGNDIALCGELENNIPHSTLPQPNTIAAHSTSLSNPQNSSNYTSKYTFKATTEEALKAQAQLFDKLDQGKDTIPGPNSLKNASRDGADINACGVFLSNDKTAWIHDDTTSETYFVRLIKHFGSIQQNLKFIQQLYAMRDTLHQCFKMGAFLPVELPGNGYNELYETLDRILTSIKKYRKSYELMCKAVCLPNRLNEVEIKLIAEDPHAQSIVLSNWEKRVMKEPHHQSQLYESLQEKLGALREKINNLPNDNNTAENTNTPDNSASHMGADATKNYVESHDSLANTAHYAFQGNTHEAKQAQKELFDIFYDKKQELPTTLHLRELVANNADVNACHPAATTSTITAENTYFIRLLNYFYDMIEKKDYKRQSLERMKGVVRQCLKSGAFVPPELLREKYCVLQKILNEKTTSPFYQKCAAATCEAVCFPNLLTKGTPLSEKRIKSIVNNKTVRDTVVPNLKCRFPNTEDPQIRDLIERAERKNPNPTTNSESNHASQNDEPNIETANDPLTWIGFIAPFKDNQNTSQKAHNRSDISGKKRGKRPCNEDSCAENTSKRRKVSQPHTADSSTTTTPSPLGNTDVPQQALESDQDILDFFGGEEASSTTHVPQNGQETLQATSSTTPSQTATQSPPTSTDFLDWLFDDNL